jgi:cytochrome P450
MENPKNPIDAVTHPDPYPYYAELRAKRPLYYDQGLDIWIASGGREIEEIFGHENCLVRPARERIPTSVISLRSGEIFGGLVRMKDGVEHSRLKPSVSEAIALINREKIAERSRVWAKALIQEIDVATRLDRYIFELPVYVMGDLLGLSREELSKAAEWVGDFVRGVAPGADEERLDRGDAAAGHLLRLFDELQNQGDQGRARGLFHTLTQTIEGSGDERQAVIAANGIGFMSQAYDATAGLIGNTVLALVEQKEAREFIEEDESLLVSAIFEVLRYDAPVQNTRRYLSADRVIAGQKMREGQGILLIVAAANRDPRYNPEPDRFDLFRKHRRSFTFGLGRHACPGSTLAVAIAAAGVRELRRSGVEFMREQKPRRYRPSVNARIPLFGK